MSEETPPGQVRSRKGKRTAKKHISPEREPRIDKEQEQVLKFLIGLRLLGETRQQRYLTYLQHLRDETQPQKDCKH